MASKSTVTRYTALGLGAIAAATISAAVANSLFTRGDVVFDTTSNQNPSIVLDTTDIMTFSGSTVTLEQGDLKFGTSNATPCIYYGTRAIDCFQQAAFANTGASVGAKYYNVASVTKPYTGSGVIKRVEISCDNQGVSTVVSVDQLASLTTSGVTIFDHKTIGSGSLVSYVAEPRLDSTSTGATIWAESTPYIKVSARARVGVSQCVLGVWSHEMYNP